MQNRDRYSKHPRVVALDRPTTSAPRVTARGPIRSITRPTGEKRFTTIVVVIKIILPIKRRRFATETDNSARMRNTTVWAVFTMRFCWTMIAGARSSPVTNKKEGDTRLSIQESPSGGFSFTPRFL